MKKSLSLVLALVLLVAAFTGCAGIDEKKEEARGGIFRDYVTVSPAILNTHINLNSFPNLKKYPLIIIGNDNIAIKKA